MLNLDFLGTLGSIWSSIKRVIWEIWIIPFNWIRNLPPYVKVVIVLMLVSIALWVIYWGYKNKNLWKYY
jgi:hypothetical protein